MKLTELGLVVGLTAIGLLAGPAAAQSTKALEVCAVTALQQAMLVRSVVAQSALRDSRGRVVGTKLDLAVNALGKKKTMSCYYTDATRTAIIRDYRPGAGGQTGSGSGDLAQQRRDAMGACQNAVRQRGLILDRVVSASDVFNRQGQITGRDVVMHVRRNGQPGQAVCEYDYASRRTVVDLRRGTTR